jgi:hypothetical protein
MVSKDIFNKMGTTEELRQRKPSAVEKEASGDTAEDGKKVDKKKVEASGTKKGDAKLKGERSKPNPKLTNNGGGEGGGGDALCMILFLILGLVVTSGVVYQQYMSEDMQFASEWRKFGVPCVCNPLSVIFLIQHQREKLFSHYHRLFHFVSYGTHPRVCLQRCRVMSRSGWKLGTRSRSGSMG